MINLRRAVTTRLTVLRHRATESATHEVQSRDIAGYTFSPRCWTDRTKHKLNREDREIKVTVGPPARQGSLTALSALSLTRASSEPLLAVVCCRVLP